MGLFSFFFRRPEPVNVIGPFHLPEPDDPRWVGEWDHEEWWVYRLGCITCRAGALHDNGLIYIDNERITQAQRGDESFSKLENLYATALHREQCRQHPDLKVRRVVEVEALRSRLAEKLREVER